MYTGSKDSIQIFCGEKKYNRKKMRLHVVVNMKLQMEVIPNNINSEEQLKMF